MATGFRGLGGPFYDVQSGKPPLSERRSVNHGSHGYGTWIYEQMARGAACAWYRNKGRRVQKLKLKLKQIRYFTLISYTHFLSYIACITAMDIINSLLGSLGAIKPRYSPRADRTSHSASSKSATQTGTYITLHQDKRDIAPRRQFLPIPSTAQRNTPYCWLNV